MMLCKRARIVRIGYRRKGRFEFSGRRACSNSPTGCPRDSRVAIGTSITRTKYKQRATLKSMKLIPLFIHRLPRTCSSHHQRFHNRLLPRCKGLNNSVTMRPFRVGMRSAGITATPAITPTTNRTQPTATGFRLRVAIAASLGFNRRRKRPPHPDKSVGQITDSTARKASEAPARSYHHVQRGKAGTNCNLPRGEVTVQDPEISRNSIVIVARK